MKWLVVALALAACAPRVASPPRHAPPPVAEALVPPDGPRVPRTLVPRGYQVALAFDGSGFTGTVTIDAELAEPSRVLWLHAAGLDITSARATQGARSIALVATTVPARALLALDAGQPLAGEWTIEVAYRGTLARDAGIVGSGSFVVTQLTPMNARRAFPCIDEPDRKVPWQLTLDVAPAHVVLANTAIVRETMVGGRKRVELARTPPIPSHLVAFAVGPFDIIDAGTTKRGVPVRIAVPFAMRGDAAFAVARTAALVDLAERVLGVSYPYDKLDLVAVTRTHGSYPGLVTFEIERLRGGWLAAMSGAIARQWFGGQVTPRWWDDVWLRDGLATYVGDTLLAALGPDAVEPPYEREERVTPATRVRPSVADIADPRALGTYLGGEPSAPVLAWLERYVGPPAMVALLRSYLENHANGVATSDDFVELVPEPQLRTALAARLDANVATDPPIASSVLCDGGSAEITLTIRDPVAWPIAPACVVYEQDGKRVESCEFLSPARTIKTAKCPAWVVASERTPSVEPMSTPETLFAIAWPQLHDSERARALSRAQGELALRMAERMYAVDATREIAAWHLLQFERFVPDSQRAAFDAKIRTLIGKRASAAILQRNTILANPNTLTLAALTGDVDARAALVKLIGDPTRVPSALYFALRVAVRFDPTVAARLFDRVPERPSFAAFLREAPAIIKMVTDSRVILDSDLRLELLSGGCDRASVEALGRTSHREVLEATDRVRACMKLRDGLAPAFAAWLRGKPRR